MVFFSPKMIIAVFVMFNAYIINFSSSYGTVTVRHQTLIDLYELDIKR